ncbi:hypothetical protein OH491_17665 [Termitidicoccus mucosus]|uniref:hypothetical protein n=1 Tax=Termitidicoccus mucosus TaxID=1184151 RepID=UPI0011AB418F
MKLLFPLIAMCLLACSCMKKITHETRSGFSLINSGVAYTVLLSSSEDTMAVIFDHNKYRPEIVQDEGFAVITKIADRPIYLKPGQYCVFLENFSIFDEFSQEEIKHINRDIRNIDMVIRKHSMDF